MSLIKCPDCNGEGYVSIPTGSDEQGNPTGCDTVECPLCLRECQITDRREQEPVTEEHVREYLSEYFEFGKEGMADLDEIMDVLKGAGCIFGERKK